MFSMTKLIYYSKDMFLVSKKNSIRPTNVNEKTYIRFGNKCRENRDSIGIVLERLMCLYIDKGKNIFK